MVRGGHDVPTFFHMAIFMRKGLEVQNFVTFPNSLWTFRKSNKFFLVFHSVLGWSRRCGLIQPPPHTPTTYRSPAILGLNALPLRLLELKETYLLSYPHFRYVIASKIKKFLPFYYYNYTKKSFILKNYVYSQRSEKQ